MPILQKQKEEQVNKMKRSSTSTNCVKETKENTLYCIVGRQHPTQKPTWVVY